MTVRRPTDPEKIDWLARADSQGTTRLLELMRAQQNTLKALRGSRIEASTAPTGGGAAKLRSRLEQIEAMMTGITKAKKEDTK